MGGILNRLLNPIQHVKDTVKSLKAKDLNTFLDPSGQLLPAPLKDSKASTLDTTGNGAPGATNRGMYMGARGPTTYLNGQPSMQRTYAPNPFAASPTAQGMQPPQGAPPPMGQPMGGGGIPMGQTPIGMGAPPGGMPPPPMKQPMAQMSSPKMPPQMGGMDPKQQMMIDMLRNRGSGGMAM